MTKRLTTKEKILNVLKRNSNSSMKDIMDHFTISEIAVRRHIQELEQQGFVKSESIKQKIGRPYHVYDLTKQGHNTFPNKYEKLPVELLQDLEDVYGKQAVKDILDKRMEREEANYKSRMNLSNIDQRIAEFARIQEEKGYMVEYEKIEDNLYELKNYNCPIINIASEYKQVCSNERTILSNMFPDSEVILHSSITKGDNYCKWTVKQPQKNSSS